MIRLLCLVTFCCCLSAAELPTTVTLRSQGDAWLFTLKRLATLSKAGIVIHHAAQESVQETITFDLVAQPWTEFAETLAFHGLVVELQDDVLMVHSRDVYQREHLYRALYTTAVVAQAIKPRPGPRLGAQEAPEIASEPRLILGHRNDSTYNELIEDVQATIGAESWANEGVAIEDYSGAMVLVQSPKVHRMVQEFLARTERDHVRQLLVRGYRLAQPPASKEPVLDAAAWTALAKPAPEIAFTVIDGRHNHHFSGIRRAYVAADLFENRLGSPIMGTLLSGWVLDVQPHFTLMGTSARIRLQATVAESMTTSPVKDAAGRLLFDIDLPDQRTDEADDVRLIPPGGAALYRFDDRTYAVSVDLLDVIPTP